jgi:hypothetical protein
VYLTFIQIIIYKIQLIYSWMIDHLNNKKISYNNNIHNLQKNLNENFLMIMSELDNNYTKNYIQSAILTNDLNSFILRMNLYVDDRNNFLYFQTLNALNHFKRCLQYTHTLREDLSNKLIKLSYFLQKTSNNENESGTTKCVTGRECSGESVKNNSNKTNSFKSNDKNFNTFFQIASKFYPLGKNTGN